MLYPWKNSNLVRLIEVPVCFYDLLDRVADEIGHHHNACTLVDQHTHEGMAEIVNSDRLHLCGTAISNKALLLLWILFGCYVLITQLLERVSLPFVCIVFIVLMSFLSFGIAVVFEPQLFGSVGNLLGFFMLPLLLYCIKSTAVSYSVRKIVFVCNFIMS